MTLDINAKEDLVPLSHLGEGSQYVRDVIRTGRPKLVTEGDVGVAVIVDLDTFQALQEETDSRRLLRDLQQAVSEADNGQLHDHNTTMAEARTRHLGTPLEDEESGSKPA